MSEHDTNTIKMRLLLVDDEAPVRHILRAMLEDFQFEIIEAENANMAWEFFQTRTFDLVITDIRMPGTIDGLELTEKIINKDFSVPVIVITAYDDRDRILKALRFGASDFLSKPVDQEFLSERVSQALEKRKLALAELRVIDLLHEMIGLESESAHKQMNLHERLDYIQELVAVISIAQERRTHGLQ